MRRLDVIALALRVVLLLDSLGIPLIVLAEGQMIIGRIVERQLVMMQMTIAVSNGDVGANGHGLVRAAFGLTLVGMLEKETDKLDTQQLFYLAIILVREEQGIVLQTPLPASDGAIHSRIVTQLLLTV